MKKLITLTAVAAMAFSLASSLHAEGDQGVDITKFVKQRMEWSKNKKDWNPTPESLKAKFKELDTDKNGLVTQAEIDAGKKK